MVRASGLAISPAGRAHPRARCHAHVHLVGAHSLVDGRRARLATGISRASAVLLSDLHLRVDGSASGREHERGRQDLGRRVILGRGARVARSRQVRTPPCAHATSPLASPVNCETVASHLTGVASLGGRSSGHTPILSAYPREGAAFSIKPLKHSVRPRHAAVATAACTATACHPPRSTAAWPPRPGPGLAPLTRAPRPSRARRPSPSRCHPRA